MRLWGSRVFFLDGDEGYFLYDALLWNKGLVPFKDFLLGSPVYIYFIKIATIVLGRRIIAGRGISVVLSAATIILIYLIGERLWDKKVGLIASLMFAFSPFTIFWGSAIKTEPNVSFFVALAFLIAIISYQEDKNWLALISGFILGMAAYIRLSVFTLTFALLIIFAIYYLLNKRSISKFLINAAYLITGFILVYGLITWYLALQSSLNAVLAGWSPVVISLPDSKSTGQTINIINALMQVVSSIGVWFLRINRDGGYLLILPLAFIAIYLKKYFKNNYVYIYIVYIIFSLAIVLLLIKAVLLNSSYGLYYYISLAGLALILLPIFNIIKLLNIEEDKNMGSVFVIVWFVILLASYLIFSKNNISESYFYELSIPAALCGGYIISKAIYEKFNVRYLNILISIILIWAVFPYIFFFKAHGESRYWNLKELNKISVFLSKKGIGKNDSDVMFTGNMIPLYVNDLKSFKNISHPVIYFGEKEMTDQKLKVLNNPTQPEIISAMKTGKIKYILWDERTRRIFGKYPRIIKAMQDNYEIYSNVTRHSKIYINKFHTN